MPPRQSVDDKLLELESSVEAAAAEAVRPLLDRALGDRHYRLVALAAKLAGERLAYDCVPALLRAWPRFLEQPVKRDPNCLAKKAIARALYDLDCDDVDFYLEAVARAMKDILPAGTPGKHPLGDPLRADNWETAGYPS